MSIMVRRKKKTQISVYLDPEIMTMLTDYAARRDQSQSMIAEAAIASFLLPDADERREAAIAKRIDQVDRSWRFLFGSGSPRDRRCTNPRPTPRGPKRTNATSFRLRAWASFGARAEAAAGNQRRSSEQCLVACNAFTGEWRL
jgi:predicted transcriptional regulator